jgi:hypothetical protein
MRGEHAAADLNGLHPVMKAINHRSEQGSVSEYGAADDVTAAF